MTGRLDEESYARAALTFLAEPADLRLAALLRTCGAVQTLAAIKAGRFPDAAENFISAATLDSPTFDSPTFDSPTLDSATFGGGATFGSATFGSATSGGGATRAMARRAMERWRVRLAELPSPDEIAGLCRAGIRLACPGDPEWPARLDDLGDARPYALWLRGSADLRFTCLRSVAIVGSRVATSYGAYVASEFAASVAARGWGIVSGAAYGIDAAAHRGALAADGVTVAVLACGVDVPYPVGHTGLLDAIAAAGVIISEWPPGRTVTRLRFLTRNRVIAALAGGTLVVEAGQRSGALNSARHARDLGRLLMAVPGPITSELSMGCHTIIRDWQGVLVTSAADVVELLSPAGASPPAAQHGRQTAGREPVLERDALDRQTAAVLDALPLRGGSGPGKIAARAGLDLPTVMRSLGALAAGGFAERCDQGWRVRRARTASGA